MKRVLIAEENDNIRLKFSELLQAEGYAVFTVANGETAKELLLKQSFFLAFIDVNLPLISVANVLKSIREKGIMMPVIIITASSVVSNSDAYIQEQATAYLHYPFTNRKVKAAIAELTASWPGIEEEEAGAPASFTQAEGCKPKIL